MSEAAEGPLRFPQAGARFPVALRARLCVGAIGRDRRAPVARMTRTLEYPMRVRQLQHRCLVNHRSARESTLRRGREMRLLPEQPSDSSTSGGARAER